MAADWVAIRPIDHPLGSGVFAFQPGDVVPDGHVKAYGYDKVSKDDGGPYVARETSAAAAEVKPTTAAPKKATAAAGGAAAKE